MVFDRSFLFCVPSGGFVAVMLHGAVDIDVV